MTETNVEKLPHFNGRPVPWITRWTGEVKADRTDFGVQVTGNPWDGGYFVTYPDGKNMRDAKGVLWQREGLGRAGEPMWADVSTYRQRAAMKKTLCQVCGDKIAAPPYRFIIPVNSMEQFDKDTMVTMQAPVCEPCIPLALRLCPALKREGYQILKVAQYSLWGVFGIVAFPQDGGFGRMQTAVSFDTSTYGSINLTHVMAQQSVISLDKYVIEETVAGRKPTIEPLMSEVLHRLEQGDESTVVNNELGALMRAGEDTQ